MLELEVTRPEETFKDVVALYSALAENRRNLRVRQVEINSNGEVTAEPLDFMLDCESKAKRVLAPGQYVMFRMFAENGFANRLPAEIQIALGTKWYEDEMGIEGPYRTLYFRVKNRADREQIISEANSGLIGDGTNSDSDGWDG